MEELNKEKLPYSGSVRLGIMIETPAAVWISDLLAKETDFFSCGTNDLAQYTLACDRHNPDLYRFLDPHHPALLRSLETVAQNAYREGIPVGVCGELAADPEMLGFFLRIGIDELSVSPTSILPLRKAVTDF
jgi:phosphotransferase system enzyme I (PtsI)